MEKILSQEEIDALLNGIEDGKVATSPEPQVGGGTGGGTGTVPYDFSNQDRTIRGRMPTLEVLNDFFSRSLRNTLTLVLRKSLEVIPQKLTMMKYGEFTKALPLPCSIHVFKMNPLRGNGLLVLDPKLVFSFVDIFLGGTGRMNFRIEGRDFTSIESRLIMKVVNMIFTDLEKVWSSIHSVSFQYVRSEFNHQFAAIVPPEDLVLTIPLALEMEQITGLITLCIPYSSLEPIKTKLCSGFQTEQLELDHSWVRRLVDQLRKTEVEMVVELGKASINTQSLLRLKVGDVLPLEKDVSESLVAKIQEVPKFLGKAGIYGSNKAFQIDARMKTL
jgi:flagellar motor switch protein FliM